MKAPGRSRSWLRLATACSSPTADTHAARQLLRKRYVVAQRQPSDRWWRVLEAVGQHDQRLAACRRTNHNPACLPRDGRICRISKKKGLSGSSRSLSPSDFATLIDNSSAFSSSVSHQLRHGIISATQSDWELMAPISVVALGSRALTRAQDLLQARASEPTQSSSAGPLEDQSVQFASEFSARDGRDSRPCGRRCERRLGTTITHVRWDRYVQGLGIGRDGDINAVLQRPHACTPQQGVGPARAPGFGGDFHAALRQTEAQRQLALSQTGVFS